MPQQIRLGALILLTLVAGMSGLISIAAAQIPDEFKNLKVLKKDIGKRELVGKMRNMAGALGVRCNYCHVGEDPNSLQGYDWTSDEKASKRAARAMMQMVDTINNTHLPAMKLEGEARVAVSCVTCHRGQDKPRMIEDVLATASETGGIEALGSKYKELRDEYYGAHTFNFSNNVLSNMAQETAAKGDMPGAKQLLELNLEYYPEDAMTYVLLARVAEEEDDKTAAIGYYDKAIEYQKHEGMKARLRAMKKKLEES